jgi:hypothetical protein
VAPEDQARRKQGPELWNKIEIPKVIKDRASDRWSELKQTEKTPHRPDDFFHAPLSRRPPPPLFTKPTAVRRTPRAFKIKLRVHYNFVVKDNLQRTTPAYNVPSIRAVLIETTDWNWASQLRESGKHPAVSPKPSPLFWFTTSQLFFQ